MKAFVTGAAGLLGVNLVRALRWEGITSRLWFLRTGTVLN